MSCPRGEASPDQHTKYRLFSESGGFCQNPACNRQLFITTSTQRIHIAEMAHVFAAANKGPRANIQMSEADRGSFDNLIMLCSNCHTIVDKAAKDFPDSLMLEWKNSHAVKLRSIFQSVKCESRGHLRRLIEPLLAENAFIFKNYNPDLDYRYDPESEIATDWQRKMRCSIIPNNRKTLALLDANVELQNKKEREVSEDFRQHIYDLEMRHLAEGDFGSQRRFPADMQCIMLGD